MNVKLLKKTLFKVDSNINLTQKVQEFSLLSC